MTNWELESGSEVIVCDRGGKMIRRLVRSERSESGEGNVDRRHESISTVTIQIQALFRFLPLYVRRCLVRVKNDN